MKTNISHTPSEEASAFIEEKLALHKNEPILFLISGGSSLCALEKINPNVLSPLVTIVTTDERFTINEQGNNFKQFQATSFYQSAVAAGVTCIASVPQENERHEQFAERMRKSLEEYFDLHPSGYALGVFGIGEDGHTASIFPTSEAEFNEAYRTDALYVPVTQPQLQYPFRTTVTPSFIEEKIDDVVLFAVGSTKCDNILNYMHNKNFSQYQIPALIPAQHPRSVLFTDCHTLL